MSGAVFTIGKGHPTQVVGDKTLYFCCPPCADYFGQHKDSVLAKRGLSI